MTLKTLEKTTFGKIKIGEVCFLKLSWSGLILYKKNNSQGFVLSDFQPSLLNDLTGNIEYIFFNSCIYRLPKSVQSLWIS